MTVLEESVKDLQSSIKLQIKLVKKVAVLKERKDEIEPMKERLIENLHIHLADADAELTRVHRLRDTLPTPEEYAKVNGDHLVRKRFVLQLLFGALGTYMGTLPNQKYGRLQESLTTTNIVQKKLIEVVNNQEQSIQRIHDTIERYTTFVRLPGHLKPSQPGDSPSECCKSSKSRNRSNSECAPDRTVETTSLRLSIHQSAT
jgi:hypothetical protein